MDDTEQLKHLVRDAKREAIRRHGSIKHMATGFYEHWLHDTEGLGTRPMFNTLARKAWDAALAFHDYSEEMSQDMVPGDQDDDSK